MPVTAKLSKKFYDRLGEDLANELVEWFNLVDATYKSDLREMNETNFARFDAKLEQRLAEFRAQFGAEIRAEMYAGFGRLEKSIADTRAELIKWSFVFWVGTVITIGGPLLVLLNR
jgi:hypothetical protein